MTRLRALPVRHLVLIGAVLGLIIASTVTIASTRRYEASSIYLLGSGSGLSALIASEAARVLIVGGDDPAALASAFADARPSMLRRIDLIILAPGASERVAERAVEIANPRRLYALPNDRFHPGNEILGHMIRPMDGPSSISGLDGLSISLDLSDARGWTMIVGSGSSRVLLTDRIPFRPAADAVVMMGPHVGEQAGALNVPVIAAETAFPDKKININDGSQVHVKQAAILQIRLEDHRLAIHA